MCNQLVYKIILKATALCSVNLHDYSEGNWKLQQFFAKQHKAPASSNNTNSMEQSSSWEAHSHSAGQEIP
jgi:hypothetical protein